jgi:hypothetical protein
VGAQRSISRYELRGIAAVGRSEYGIFKRPLSFAVAAIQWFARWRQTIGLIGGLGDGLRLIQFPYH